MYPTTLIETGNVQDDLKCQMFSVVLRLCVFRVIKETKMIRLQHKIILQVGLLFKITSHRTNFVNEIYPSDYFGISTLATPCR